MLPGEATSNAADNEHIVIKTNTYSTVRERSYNGEMGAPYSQDLRLRALAALDKGMSKTNVHQTFKISRSTLDDWPKLRSETGKVEANTAYRRGPAPALSDNPALRAFIELLILPR